MKKKFKVILCVLLAVVLLMGCGKTEKPEVSSEEKFAEAKVEESSVQEASKAETESSQEESKASDIGSDDLFKKINFEPVKFLSKFRRKNLYMYLQVMYME